MPNKLSYWKLRLLQIAVDRDKKDQEYIESMKQRYDELSKSIHGKMQEWMNRYADNEGITKDEVYQLLSKDEQRNWKMALSQFREKAIDGGYEQELNEEYYRSRISRLEHLERQIYFELAEVAKQEEEHMQAHLKEQLNESYLRTIYELTDRGSFLLPFDRYNSRALEIAISNPWIGSNFSKRIWKNHLETIPDKLSKVMSQAIVQGWAIDKTVNAMMYGIDKPLRNRMTTLVQTESAHIAEVANEKAMEETGVEKWEWLATLEIHTCARCAGLDGREFDVGDSNAPNCPDHPNCRCTKIPVIVGWSSSKRWQRDPITGKGSIEDYQTFDEWKKDNVMSANKGLADISKEEKKQIE